MAEAYLDKRLKEEGLEIEVASAGTVGVDKLFPTQETLKVLEEEGIDTKGYRSKTLSEDFIRWADIILVMEPSHKARIRMLVPEAEDKIYYLGEFNKEHDSVIIPDPIGKPLASYRKAFNLIKQPIEELVEWLKA